MQKNYFGFTHAPRKGQTCYWPIMTADAGIKCRCVNSGMTGQVGGFQNRGVCLQAFPSFLPHPLPALLLAPFFARSLTLVPRSLLLNRTETLATQARSGTVSGSIVFRYPSMTQVESLRYHDGYSGENGA